MRIDILVEADKEKEKASREFLDMRLNAHIEQAKSEWASMKELFNIVLSSQKEAVDKAEASMKQQLESMIAVVDTKDQARQTQIREVEKRVDRDEGKNKGISQSWGIAIAVITLLISVIVIVANLMTAT